MKGIQKVFKRANLHQLRAFLLTGSESTEIQEETYSERLRQECAPIYNRLENMYVEPKELDQAMSDLSQAFTAYEEVYVEIGMKAGARLTTELLTNVGTVNS